MTTLTLPSRSENEAAQAPAGPPANPRWVRPAVLGLLLGTLGLYLWSLSASGWANSFYSAAVQAGSESWKAFFFGSSDASNFITVDKPPASLWPMELSVRIFGLNSWSMLVPEALMGVAAVYVLFAAVRRRFGAAAGLIAGASLAVTPVAALMFRYNNPEALLTLLMVCAVYCTQRATEQARTKWLLLAGVAIGFGFLTKTFQAFLILPGLALVYGVCAPTRLRRRLWQLAAALGAIVVSGGWWVAIVELWPASSRPYIGGSQDNSFLSLTFGYNGFGRLTGNETGSLGATGNSSATGVFRMFTTEMGGQISWLLPAAVILLVGGLWVTRKGGRADDRRSALLVWGASLLCTLAVFDFMSGIFHAYYTIALAPYIAALVGMGAGLLWEHRRGLAASSVLGGTVAVTAIWSYVLLGRASADSYTWLRWVVLPAGLIAAVGMVLAGRLNRRLALAAASLGIVASLAGPFAYTLTTVGTAHTGALPTAGPSTGGMGMGGGGGRPGGGTGGGNAPTGQGGQARTGTPPQGNTGTTGNTGTAPTGGGGGMGGGANIGALLNGVTVSSKMTALLKADADSYTWAAATVGSTTAASYQLASGEPVMAIGGFNGTDPTPTLAAFKKYVAEGKIHYFIASGSSSSGTSNAAKIAAWVAANYTKTTVGSTTVYDLSGSS
ncbi:ArnT family glycosyltransferase [Streptomyces sp. NBC_01262]|uniref:ArnT family glycosyltransferase n=1 Tax=Streptomyces sp. NBC_01262 TaxID=2903803 RepID=UPI002E2F0A9F|nr:glycosyltransferase family 39 protein [Streptomyces sp. NBC_01262]